MLEVSRCCDWVDKGHRLLRTLCARLRLYHLTVTVAENKALGLHRVSLSVVICN